MPNPTAALLVIGDEILSGRTRDANIQFLAEKLGLQGIELREVRVVSDDHDRIVAAVRALAADWDIVFTSGGIGPTHDDITADAVAAAFERAIDVRDDARAILATHYEGTENVLTEARLRMARVPDGADLIENQVSGAPGFILENVHVCAGVPRIFQAMVTAVLPGLATGDRVLSRTIRVELPEGDIAGPLGKVAARFPEVSVGSYPFFDGVYGSNIVMRHTDENLLDRVAAAVEQALNS